MNNDIVARYEQAQMFMQGIMTKSVVMNDAVFPHWIEESHCFWYIRETKNGKEFRLVNAESASNILAFNHKALAEILTTTTGKNIDFQDLPIENVTIISSPLQICSLKASFNSSLSSSHSATFDDSSICLKRTKKSPWL